MENPTKRYREMNHVLYSAYKKVKIVFVNFENIRRDNFNLDKSLRNNCKGVYFLLRKELLHSFFAKYCPLYFKDMAIVFF